jgi:hypothetical protein
MRPFWDNFDQGGNAMNQLLIQFTYLQLLDFLTTIAFLVQGVGEANPVVRLAMSTNSGVLPGLVAVKIAALALGLYCWRLGKQRLLGRINLLFAGLVAWNLAVIILASVRKA